ncbi:MAG: Cys-rich protein [Leptospiraceae bacterium]|nr:Cys-rich protein [Leptospiraceae bacterium]
MFSKMLKTLVLAGFFVSVTPSLFAEDCIKACAKFYSCSEEMHKRKPTADEQAKLEKACTQTCAKFTKPVLECYASSVKAGGNCTTYGKCMMDAANSKKKK